MSIVLFAIIGATIEAGAGYWICFSVFCLLKVMRFIADLIKEAAE